MKDIKVYLSVPSEWIDIGSPTLWVSRTIMETARQEIQNAIVAQYVSKIKLPKIKISNKELKKAILNKMAEKALEKR